MALRVRIKTRQISFQCVSHPLIRLSRRTYDQAANWTWAKPYGGERLFPQTIAHRGYKAEHPENTMKSFEGAVEVGSHAIETDIHLSKDDVVLLSHVSCRLVDGRIFN